MTKYIRWIVTLLLALATAGVAWFWTQSFEGSLRSARFLKLKGNVALERNKTVLDGTMIEIIELPEVFAQQLGNVAEPVASMDALVGLRAVQDVPAGAILLKQFFSPESMRDLSDQIEPGHRAITLAVNAESTVGYFVRPGSRVDLIGTFVQPEASTTSFQDRLSTRARVLIENVRILAAGPALSHNEYQRLSERGYGTVTLEVTPHQASMIVFAQQQLNGPLTMVLRRNDESGSTGADGAAVDWTTFSKERTAE